ncbi:MAG: T9SS type A sorting domain-containing protein [Bacteroidales bacterium]|nr:T9SS type A sorting domain-containing protein [Bacteroidales bacterium]
MKKYYILLLVSFLGLYVSGQSISSYVIGSAGESVEAGGISVSWTLGELAIETLEDNGNTLILTQGFQQGYLETNNAPTAISLSVNTISEDKPIGSVIGLFSSTDPDNGDTFNYSLVSGDGTNDADNSDFSIESNELKTTSLLDYDIQNVYNIYVRTTDAGGLYYEKSFDINVTDVVGTAVIEILQSKFKVFPNPASEFVWIEFESGEIKEAIIELYDLDGKLVYNNIFNITEIRTQIDIANLSSSQYILKISDSEGKELQNFKLIKR